jgi:hypothetical protein
MKIKIKDVQGITLNTEKKYCKENIRITIDPELLVELKPENIAKGTNILGVEGTSDAIITNASATANTILKGKTAYVNGEKVVGTLEMSNYSKEFTGYGERIANYIVLYNTQGLCVAPPSLIDVTKLPEVLPTLTLNDYEFNG